MPVSATRLLTACIHAGGMLMRCVCVRARASVVFACVHLFAVCVCVHKVWLRLTMR